MLISTMNDLPGYEIDEVLGEVFGLTVRSRNVGSQIGAALKSLFGGELRGMTKMLADGREDATARLVGEANAKGANAILAFRFDTSELGSTWTEICAYGTAATVEPIADGPGSTAQSQQLSAQPVPQLQPQAPAQGYGAPQMVPPVQGQVPWPPPGAPRCGTCCSSR